MKTIRQVRAALALFMFLVAVAGCASLQSFFEDKPLPERIDDARLIISAVAKQIESDALANPPLITKAQGEREIAELEKALAIVDEAEKYLKLDDISTAEGKMKLANSALSLLRSELAKRDAQRSKGGD